MELVTVHLIILLSTAVAILYADHLAYRYFRGTIQILDRVTIERLHRIVWVGLMGMIATGIGLFIPMAPYFIYELAFYIKMGFILILVINAVAIGRIHHVALERPYIELNTKERRRLLVSGAVSGISWISVVLIGFFFL